uniref:Immunoglobulin domain-containing protein n=1 Tax=Dicentrarchus labrax TaxID=13489 RepID=A0A8C4HW01_DICLA
MSSKVKLNKMYFLLSNIYLTVSYFAPFPFAHPGDSVTISCKYPNNEKFLCKGESPLNCEELIHTTQLNRDVVKVKFNIRDNKRLKYFYVTIKNVSTADSGTYWCASNRSWQDVLTHQTKVISSVSLMLTNSCFIYLHKYTHTSTAQTHADTTSHLYLNAEDNEPLLTACIL